MNLDYNFKLDIAKSLKNCLEKFYDSRQYYTKTSIQEMEQIDELLDDKKITCDEHKKMCEDIKITDQKYIRELICLLSGYISFANRKDFNEANYDMYEVIKENAEYNKILNMVIRETAKIVENF